MKSKLLACALIVSAFAASSIYAAKGNIPRCSNGAFNMVIQNADLSQCDSQSGNCIYYSGFELSPYGDEVCEDKFDLLLEQTNASFSFEKAPNQVVLEYHVYFNKVNLSKSLKFIYNNGHVSNNCAEVFGGAARCEMSQDLNSSKQGVTYTLTLARSDSK